MVNDIPLLPDRGVCVSQNNVPKAERTWQKHTGCFNELLIIGRVPGVRVCVCVCPIDINCHTNAGKTSSVCGFRDWTFF